jgi:hypothetical protein
VVDGVEVYLEMAMSWTGVERYQEMARRMAPTGERVHWGLLERHA